MISLDTCHTGRVSFCQAINLVALLTTESLLEPHNLTVFVRYYWDLSNSFVGRPMVWKYSTGGWVSKAQTGAGGKRGEVWEWYLVGRAVEPPGRVTGTGSLSPVCVLTAWFCLWVIWNISGISLPVTFREKKCHKHEWWVVAVSFWCHLLHSYLTVLQSYLVLLTHSIIYSKSVTSITYSIDVCWASELNIVGSSHWSPRVVL